MKVTVYYWRGTTQHEGTANNYQEATELAGRNQNAHDPTFFDEDGDQLYDDGRGLLEPNSGVYAM